MPRHIATIACPLYGTGPDNTRNSEQSIIELRDGRLLIVYSNFYGGGEDFSPSDIGGRISDDGGQTWGEPFQVVPNRARMNTCVTSLLRLQSDDPQFSKDWGFQTQGELALFHYQREALLHRNGLYFQTSRDEGQTWSSSVRINEMPTVAHLAFVNDTAMQHSTGRIILPVHGCFGGLFGGFMYFSDDRGCTWQRSSEEIVVKERVPFEGVPHPDGIEVSFTFFEEPAIVELKDGKIMAFGRTNLGRIYSSTSENRGDTWCDPQPTELASSYSPCALKRIPSTGDLICVWNQVSEVEIRAGWSRCRMSVAVSKDDGRTWEHFKSLDSLNDCGRVEPPALGHAVDAAGEVQARKYRAVIWKNVDRDPLDPKKYPKKGYLHVDYPSCAFTRDDHVVISYGAYAGAEGLINGTKVVIHPVSWFYED